MKIKEIQNQDLTYLIIKDRHGKAIFRKSIYSRMVLNFLMIAVQLGVMIFFILKLQPYLEIYLGGSLFISAVFVIYLVNCNGKNEFKIAWLIPVIFFPLFGVLAYILYHTNTGGNYVKRRLQNLKEITESYLPPKQTAMDILNNYPQVKGLGVYLVNQGNYYPHINTSVKYFPNGESFFPDLFNAVKSAKEYIFIEYFIVDVDETWTFLLEALEQKISEGVEVRLLMDGMGSPVASDRGYQKYLNKMGINSRVFLPLIPLFSTQQNNRDHRKIVIIDGKIAYTGGINIANEYMNEGENRFAYWKDNAVRIEGSAIQSFTTMFLQTWNLQKKSEDDYAKYIQCDFPVKNSPGLVIPYGDDAYNLQDIAEDIYLYIIGNAREYLHITTPYMVIDNQLQEALIFAAHRGVDVSVILPSVPDHNFTFYIGKTYLKNLMENGIKVYLYEKGFIHAKTFICDDDIATIGSVNLDYRSLFHHFECGTVMYQCEVIADIEKDFQDTLNDCRLMDMNDYKKIPSRYRIAGRVGRVFAPLI